MDSEIAHDFPPTIRIYKDGRVERLFGTVTVPPSLDEATGVHSKDVTINPQSDIYYRLYLPKNTTSKLPVLVYYHGGGFLIESAASPTYHNYLNPLASEANIVIIVSVNYRRAPEDPLPAAYEDSWEGLKWVGSHCSGSGPEEWLSSYADLNRVYCYGDSAGANIAHYVALRFGLEKIPGVSLIGFVLVHSFFWGSEPVGSETTDPEQRERTAAVWKVAHPTSQGIDDPLINPGVDPSLSKLGASKVLVCVAETDVFCSRGWYYEESLKKSGWSGSVEVMEAKGEQHVFHLFKPTCDNARALMKRLVEFFNQ